MSRTRRSVSRVSLEGSASHVPPEGSVPSGRYKWVDDVVRDANSIVSKDDDAAYLASFSEPPPFQLIEPTMEDRICDCPGLESSEDWNCSFRYEFWRVVSRPGVPAFWRYPRTGVPLFNRWWTREHFMQSSNNYYLLDAAEDDITALLDSMVDGNSVAEMRRIKLERQRRNLNTPPPANPTPPWTNKETTVNPSGQQALGKRKEPDSSRKPSEPKMTKKQMYTEEGVTSSAGVGDSSTGIDLQKQERQTTVAEKDALSKQVKGLNENLSKTVSELDTTLEALKNKKRFKAVANKNNATLKKSNEDLKL
ncbi:Myosin heavy chain-like [Sesbania bispinosa]|nr:Myosin heavy chain-like [Sesbania bispinosa]